MAKDPAFLFYSSDFLTGTMFMNNEQVGKYVRLLCMQHQQGHLTEQQMLIICGTYDEVVFSKFKKDAENKYFNERCEQEITKRKAFCESRRSNRQGNSTHNKHMNDTSLTYVAHMENENENVNIDVNTVLNTWNEFAKKHGCSQIVKLSNGRKQKIKVRLNESMFNFVEVLEKAKKQPFALTGKWFTFDWLIENDTNYLKILEMKYADKTNDNTSHTPNRKIELL